MGKSIQISYVQATASFAVNRGMDVALHIFPFTCKRKHTMKTTDIRIGDLPEHRVLAPEELELIQGGRMNPNSAPTLLSSPLEDKYNPGPNSWVREVVEDVEAY
jgi:hypothetical protein